MIPSVRNEEKVCKCQSCGETEGVKLVKVLLKTGKKKVYGLKRLCKTCRRKTFSRR